MLSKKDYFLMADVFRKIYLDRKMTIYQDNWSMYTDGALYHPASSGERNVRPEHAFLRVERQTLRKMPVSGDVLFTIRIYLDPLLALQSLPNCKDLARSLASQLMALDAAQLAYKGLAANRDALVSRLNSL